MEHIPGYSLSIAKETTVRTRTIRNEETLPLGKALKCLLGHFKFCLRANSMYQAIMLYTLNLNNVILVCQLCLNEPRKK